MAELQLDPQKTALVLIDLQNAVLGMTPAPHSADKVVENSVKLANAFRAKGAPVGMNLRAVITSPHPQRTSN